MLIGQATHSFLHRSEAILTAQSARLVSSTQFLLTLNVLGHCPIHTSNKSPNSASEQLQKQERQTNNQQNTPVNQMENTQKPIGQATMREDGSIILQLWAETDDGASGQALFSYSPTDKEYQAILEHVGGLKVGETKLVFPWADE